MDFLPNMAKYFVVFFFLLTLAPAFGQQAAFLCANGTQIPARQFCDGSTQCDGSDELHTSRATQTDPSFISCTPIAPPFTCLLHRDYICNGTVTCLGVTYCDVGCPSHYKCQNSSKCVPRSTVCDGNSCNGCPEDDGWETGVGFQCVKNGRLCRLPQQLLLDDVKDCDDGADLCYAFDGSSNVARFATTNSTFDERKCFKCLDGKMIVPRRKVCDGTIDCSDLSDECLCEGRTPDVCGHVQLRTNQKNSSICGVGEILCNASGRCLDRSMVCNAKADCINQIDEKYSYCKGTLPCIYGLASNKGEPCRCLKSRSSCVSSEGILCNGREECHLDNGVWIDPPGYPEDECRARCGNATSFQCTFPAAVPNTIRNYLCSILIQNRDGTTSTHNTSISSDSTRFCDGVIDCTGNSADETRCDRFPCRSGNQISIDMSKVCDGRLDCDGGSDEARSRCSDVRFYCPSAGNTKVSIAKTDICDFNINCDNAEDELNCTEDGRFYCESSQPLFVPASDFLDGIQDCSDWSDECPSQNNPMRQNVLSSKYELIANPVLRAVVWIMAILAFVGNAVVIFGETRKLKKIFCGAGVSASLRSNHMLVLNLAMADFLMAIYLLMLGIAGAVYSGSYCSQSLSWLTSQSCVAMGVLVVLSSETSVITMILLTSTRLFSVLKPFLTTSKPSTQKVVLLILLSWIISLLLALLPLFSPVQETFLEHALIRDSPYFRNVVVNFTTGKKFVGDLLSYHPGFANLTHSQVEALQRMTSWPELEGFVLGYSPGSAVLKVDRYFGYYSASSVCLPQLFVTTSDRSWRFSISISTFNFLAFICVAIVYVVIVAKTSYRKNINARESAAAIKQRKAVQRKIIRLIVTDFCCWIPLSIMVFVNFSGVKIDSVSYAVAAIVLLPINSALNPILYSSFVDKIVEKIRSRGKNWNLSKMWHPSHTKSTDVSLNRISYSNNK